MPSGRTHDAITVILAVPTFMAAWGLTSNWTTAAIVTIMMLFGGFMFGPDLDIQSRQYTRWGIFRFLWFPYKKMFRHRSRWSHGLIFGTLIRVLYFTLVLALVVSIAVYLRATLMGGALPSMDEISQAWLMIKTGIEQSIGTQGVWAILIGLWWGAGVHTLTDVTWSVLRKGSEIF